MPQSVKLRDPRQQMQQYPEPPQFHNYQSMPQVMQQQRQTEYFHAAGSPIQQQQDEEEYYQ